MSDTATGLRLDLGCGSVKKEGTLGIDLHWSPGVDHIVDLETQPLPFGDQSVSYVHSSHFLEHIRDPTRIFAEVSRVCADGAQLELWTPYAWSNAAFIIDHKFFFTEEVYLHMCVWFTDFWGRILGARWVLEEFQYVIDPRTLCYLRAKGISLDFAVRHLHNIVTEFCAHISVSRRDGEGAPPPVRRTFSIARSAPRYKITADRLARPLGETGGETIDERTSRAIKKAVAEFAAGAALPAR